MSLKNFSVAALLFMAMPTLAASKNLTGNDLSRPRQFVAKQIVITNFFGTLSVKKSTSQNVGLRLTSTSKKDDHLKVGLDAGILYIKGDASATIALEITMSPDTPIQAELDNAMFTIDELSNAALNLYSSKGKLASATDKIKCQMYGNSTLTIDKIQGDADFLLQDQSSVNISSGAIDTLDLELHDRTKFDFAGTVQKQLIYALNNYSEVKVQTLKGTKQQLKFSEHAQLFINGKKS